MRERMVEGILHVKRVYNINVGEVAEVYCICSPNSTTSYIVEKNRLIKCPVCGAHATIGELRKEHFR